MGQLLPASPGHRSDPGNPDTHLCEVAQCQEKIATRAFSLLKVPTLKQGKLTSNWDADSKNITNGRFGKLLVSYDLCISVSILHLHF